MKQLVLTFVITVCAFSFALAQDAEHNAVKKTLNYYLEGGTNNDFDTLKKAFHETATMKYIREGSYKEVNAIEFFKGVMKPGPKQDRETKILSVDVAGVAAHAKLEIRYDKFSFIDYMNLLKVDGEWKIVSKIFYRKPHSTY
ncbi:nuclear transport factor 2 family protein [Aureisphaera galaxeae]|uniref:nuclear transport factor 2 family protein n=1 Tax=Aureisphaera galaxeae TaxID=1538023 RepID=UPI002350869D|nr:nuclear transport factor 2 family protein [Aureisphaera galaxeae]MDC8006399.1 nuclear transport factor 2 family protein [Aureisphaera galaxeae]